MNLKLLGALAASAAAVAGSAAAKGPQLNPFDFSVTTGADYSSGKYGTTSKTKILIAPVTAAVKTDGWRLSATLPYLRIDGPAGVVIGPDGRPLPGVPTVSGVREGLGDLSLAGTYTVPEDLTNGFTVDLTGRVKFPTSKKSEHLGTGKTDYSVSADVSYPIGNWAPFVTVGYRMPGDPAGVNLKNSVSTSVGTSLAVQKTVFIASYDYTEASSPLAKDSHELFGAASAPLTDRINWTFYGIAGLSDGSPDYEAGLLLTFKLQ